MTTKTDSGPAFPIQDLGPHGAFGMTLRQYAAIHLRVPDSGTDWLDDMIRQRMRDDLAAKAMQGAMANPEVKETAESRSEWAHKIADAMLAQREKQE